MLHEKIKHIKNLKQTVCQDNDTLSFGFWLLTVQYNMKFGRDIVFRNENNVTLDT